MSLEEFVSQDNNQQQIDAQEGLFVSNFSSPVLARLIEEVRNSDVTKTHAYDRTHNRHNR